MNYTAWRRLKSALFVGFCGFLCRTPGLSTHDPNEDLADLCRSLGANRARRDLPNLVARDPRVTSAAAPRPPSLRDQRHCDAVSDG